MVQPILTACSSTIGWEMLYCWLFVTFVGGFPKWKATSWMHFAFYANYFMRVTAEKMTWVEFLTNLTVYRLVSHLQLQQCLQRYHLLKGGPWTGRICPLWGEYGPEIPESIALGMLTMVVSTLWMILVKQGTFDQYTSSDKLSKQQHSLCFCQLWESLIILPEKVWVY